MPGAPSAYFAFTFKVIFVGASSLMISFASWPSSPFNSGLSRRLKAVMISGVNTSPCFALTRAARTTAKQGDIFTPEIAAKFRRLLNPELKGDDGRDAKAIIKDDAPTNVTFKVNAKYPEGASVPTVPASLLVNLPTLPEPLQFRIIEKHLVLVDEDADVIVDYALNIIK